MRCELPRTPPQCALDRDAHHSALGRRFVVVTLIRQRTITRESRTRTVRGVFLRTGRLLLTDLADEIRAGADHPLNAAGSLHRIACRL
jgi:hypothetical protein